MDQSTAILLFFYTLLDYTLEIRFQHRRAGLITANTNTVDQLYIGALNMFYENYGFTGYEIFPQNLVKMDKNISALLNSGFFHEHFEIQVEYAEDKEGTTLKRKPTFNFSENMEKLDRFLFFNSFSYLWWRFEGKTKYCKFFEKQNNKEKQEKLMKLLLKRCKKSFYKQMKTKISSDMLLKTGVFNEEKIETELQIVKQNTFEYISFEDASLTFPLLNYHFSED